MINPVFRREVRTVLRTWKTFVAISLYILCLAAVTGLTLLTLHNNLMYNGFNPQSTTNMYTMMAGFQLGLIALIVPALTGGAISGERERQTFDLMLVTKMSTFSIILGKLLSSLVVVLLMIVAALPVFGVILYYGGVSLAHLVTMSLFFLVASAMIGSVAILFSSLFKRTVVAIVATYLVLVCLALGTIFFMLIFSQIASSFMDFTRPPIRFIFAVLSVNPFLGFLSVVDSQLGSFTAGQIVNSFSYNFNYNYSSTVTPVTVGMPLWAVNVCFNVLVVVVALALAAVVIRPAKKSKMYK